MRLIFFLFALFANISIAHAQPVGIAIADAPELSSGICFGENAVATLNCARQECQKTEGAEASDCLRILWCYPMGWTVDIFKQHREGIHWHDYSCGWDSREQLAKVVEIKCQNDFLIECTPVRIWSPQGKEIEP